MPAARPANASTHRHSEPSPEQRAAAPLAREDGWLDVLARLGLGLTPELLDLSDLRLGRRRDQASARRR